MASETASPGTTPPLDRADMVKALVSLAGIALAFAAFAVAFAVLVPEEAGLPKATVSTVVLSVVGALSLAVVVIGVIFGVTYYYETQVKASYEDRLRAVQKNLKSVASPSRVAITIVVTLIWMAIIYLYWRDIPILMELNSGATVPLFTDKFAPFVPFFLFLGAATIVINLLYLVIRDKWVPLAGEIALNAGTMLLMYWLIQAFPFSETPSQIVKTVIYMILVLLIIGIAVGTVANAVRMVRVILYGDDKGKETVK